MYQTSKAKRIPAHLLIREYLLAQIKDLPPNARIPTEVSLAEQFGVSRLTVHKTVMRLQQEGIVVRRGKGGTFVAREAHRIQLQGGRGRNGKLVIAYPNWFSYDFWLKVDGAERLALQHGMTPVPIKLNPDTPIGEIVEIVRSMDAKGLLLIAPGGVVEKAEVRTLEHLGCPCVLLQPNSHVRSGHAVYSVAPDYRKIGQLQVRANRWAVKISKIKNSKDRIRVWEKYYASLKPEELRLIHPFRILENAKRYAKQKAMKRAIKKAANK